MLLGYKHDLTDSKAAGQRRSDRVSRRDEQVGKAQARRTLQNSEKPSSTPVISGRIAVGRRDSPSG